MNWTDERSDFLEYLESKGYHPETIRTLVSYLDRYVRSPIRSPMDVMRLFSGLSISQQHHLNRGLRALFNLLELKGVDKGWLDGLRKAIPKDQIGVDIRVPEEQAINGDLSKVRGLLPKYQALWHLCLDSGIRLTEGIHLINGFTSERLQEVNGFYRYRIGEFRGNKQAYYAYFTRHTLQLIQSLGGEKLDRPDASNYYSKQRVTTPKYLRKFAFDKMISLEIPESVADFIEGRVPKRVGAKHYMVLMRQADRFYGKYAEYVSSLRDRAGLRVLS